MFNILYIVIILEDTEMLLDALIRRICFSNFLKEKHTYLLDFQEQRG